MEVPDRSRESSTDGGALLLGETDKAISLVARFGASK